MYIRFSLYRLFRLLSNKELSDVIQFKVFSYDIFSDSALIWKHFNYGKSQMLRFPKLDIEFPFLFFFKFLFHYRFDVEPEKSKTVFLIHIHSLSASPYFPHHILPP